MGHMMRSQSGAVFGLAWSPDGGSIASGTRTGAIYLWDSVTGRVLSRAFCSDRVNYLAWSPDGSTLAAGTSDAEVRLYDREVKATRFLVGHSAPVNGLAWSHDGTMLVSGSSDRTIRLWDARSGRAIRVLEGHTGAVLSVSLSTDGQFLTSQSDDGMIRLWNIGLADTIAILHEQTPGDRLFQGIAFNPKNLSLASFCEGNTGIRVWKLSKHDLLKAGPLLPSVHYANAKVVLVGDTGVGKSGLAIVLSGRNFVPTDSTHGRFIWNLETHKRKLHEGRVQLHEVLLWDLAGQPGYRLVHQLSLHEAALGLVLFDARSETNPFSGVGYWSLALDEAARGFPLVKFLVASRVDRGGPQVSRERINDVMRRYGFSGYFETSARRGDGVQELLGAIRKAIDWDKLPVISAPELFSRVKGYLVDRKAKGLVLSSARELLLHYRLETNEKVAESVFETCLGRIEAAGLVAKLSFSRQVLLQPELLDSYCAWLAQAARSEPDGLGFISERQSLAGDFPMDPEGRIRDHSEERTILVAAVEEIVGRSIAVRQPTDKGEMLVFPSELRTDMPDFPGGYDLAVSFRFQGSVKTIYATLAVRLLNSLAFKKEDLYRNAATFRGTEGQLCGFAVEYPNKFDDTVGQIMVFFAGRTQKDWRLLFLRYVNQQLEKFASKGTIVRDRLYQCCGRIIPEEIVRLRVAAGKSSVICPVCERQVKIDDLVEETIVEDNRVGQLEAQAIEEQERQKRLMVMAEREKDSVYHVFLSYNRKDVVRVRRLAKRLREQGVLPWLDEDAVLAGDQFAPKIEQIIDTIPVVAVILGAHSLGPWQEQEYYSFLQRFIERREKEKRLRLIPVLLPGANGPSDLPAFLRGFTWIDFREHKKEREETNKFVAAILSPGERT